MFGIFKLKTKFSEKLIFLKYLVNNFKVSLTDFSKIPKIFVVQKYSLQRKNSKYRLEVKLHICHKIF